MYLAKLLVPIIAIVLCTASGVSGQQQRGSRRQLRDYNAGGGNRIKQGPPANREECTKRVNKILGSTRADVGWGRLVTSLIRQGVNVRERSLKSFFRQALSRTLERSERQTWENENYVPSRRSIEEFTTLLCRSYLHEWRPADRRALRRDNLPWNADNTYESGGGNRITATPPPPPSPPTSSQECTARLISALREIEPNRGWGRMVDDLDKRPEITLGYGHIKLFLRESLKRTHDRADDSWKSKSYVPPRRSIDEFVTESCDNFLRAWKLG